MADPNEQPIIQQCVKCGSLIDVSEEEPLALMHCATCGHAMRVRQQFDHFKLLEVLGAGGMGAVYRALDLNLNRTVALKLLRQEHLSNSDIMAQFEKEAATTASINHPHVVKVFSSGTDHGMFYIAMELVDKGSLDDLMTLQGRVAEIQVLEVGIQIAQGLNAAFKRGLIHRDVKPGNILFADARTAKIVDFGLAALVDHSHEAGTEIWGTPYYVAPEKLEQPPMEDFRSDMYSLGATLFHAVAGRPPYEAEDASMVALKHLKSQPVSLQTFAPDVSSATTYVINKTLLKDPGQRYQSYEEFIEHLQYARTELQQAALNPRAKTLLVMEDERSQQLMSWITFGVVALIVMAGVLLFTFRDHFAENGAEKEVGKVEVVNKADTELAQKYQAARKTLLEGDPGAAARAAEEFRALDQPGVPQPQLNWITLHAGLAHLLAGKPGEAEADFKKIQERGLFSPDPTEQKLGQFFIDVAARASSDLPIPPSVASDLDKSNHEALALFLYALRNWSLDQFEDAGPLFRQFNSASPQGRDAWIADYKAIANTYIADFAAYRRATEAVKDAGSDPAKQRDALLNVQDANRKLKLRGRMSEKLASVEKELADELATRDAEAAKMMAEQEAADAAALAAAKAKVEALLPQYRYAEANAALTALKLTGDAPKAELDKLLRRTEWLASFKASLIKDIVTTGYAAPLIKKNGQQIPGGVRRANEQQAEVVTPYGSFAVPWTEIAPECIYAMARSFIRAGLRLEQTADRQWQLGVFTCQIGRSREGEALLNDAAIAKEEYKQHLPLFITTPEAP